MQHARMADYITTIGLEVHAQLLTASKMFCGCPAETHGAAAIPPNTHTCPICMGMPGTLPVINAHAVELGVRTALALHCTISPFSKFDRKNYPYPDLMKGYQISQYDLPIATNGWLEIETPGGPKRVGIIRLHLEEDTARLLHRQEDGTAYSLIDVNRSGVPLMEIVSAPDIASPEEASLYLVQLRQILQYLEASTGNMEEGAFRCDANVSVRPAGQQEFGTKVEIKNMNSFKAVRKALEYEVPRQIGILEAGGTVAQETRGWVDERGVTVGQRSKEFAHDYRYFPEPDLPPLTFSDEQVARLDDTLPELPAARRGRFMVQFGLPLMDADRLTATRDIADYFELAVAAASPEKARAIANLIVNDVLKEIPEDTSIAGLPMTPAHVVALLRLVDDGIITTSQARQLMPDLIRTGQDPRRLVEQRGMAQISDAAALAPIVAEIIAANPKIVADYLGGKEAALKGLLGPVMRATKGAATPQVAQELLRKQLDSLRTQTQD
jgi:aspartyl-tRNA(Asn)/glutamyl-tRNA(Gln) amidotransferase subunit B